MLELRYKNVMRGYAMLDFAKDKKFWENVRTSNDYAQHRQEILDLYKESFNFDISSILYILSLVHPPI